MENLKNDLNQSITELLGPIDSYKIERLYQYILLLHHWNQVYNLTAIRNPTDMIRLHILDSLIIEPYLSGDRWLDVGSGAGLPGIPLSIIHPQNHYTLLDSNGKKTRFLRQVIRQLALSNVEVQHVRAESFNTSKLFQGILSRGLGTLEYMIDLTEHLLSDQGHWFAMKGHYPEEELIILKKNKPHIRLQACIPLDMPNDINRHLVILQRDL